METLTLPRTTGHQPVRSLPAGAGTIPAPAAPLLEVVIPVYNEERDLAPSVRRLHAYLRERFPFPARLTIADNASSDHTWPLAQALARDLDGVRAVHLDEKGRGRARRAASLASDADVVAYMDVDLSTDLDALLPLVAPLLSGHSAVAIGSRLAPGAGVRRGLKREIISRCYNTRLYVTFRTRFRDAQCGFKAVRADAARALMPLVEDQAWFFDTELLILAQRAGLRILEVPVDWTDDADSRVQIFRTALTVDKMPLALWLMDLAVRLFGVNAWSLLVPEGLEGVAADGLLYATVRRHFEPVAALLAGAVLALTPVAALMFRFNNPDALLVLLLVGAAYAVTAPWRTGGRAGSSARAHSSASASSPRCSRPSCRCRSLLSCTSSPGRLRCAGG